MRRILFDHHKLLLNWEYTHLFYLQLFLYILLHLPPFFLILNCLFLNCYNSITTKYFFVEEIEKNKKCDTIVTSFFVYQIFELWYHLKIFLGHLSPMAVACFVKAMKCVTSFVRTPSIWCKNNTLIKFLKKNIVCFFWEIRLHVWETNKNWRQLRIIVSIWFRNKTILKM